MRLCLGGLHPALKSLVPPDEAADHILICEDRFRGKADKQGRVASTAWVEDDSSATSEMPSANEPQNAQSKRGTVSTGASPRISPLPRSLPYRTSPATTP